MPDFPSIFRVRQRFDPTSLDDLASTVHDELTRLEIARRVRPGESVAISAGSRGIDRIDLILRAMVDFFISIKARPFLVPAMGSHGGGTADGQIQILEDFGITEEAIGCPIRAQMETVIVGETGEGIPVHFDRIAQQADHVVVCNRIKPHTMFTGDIQSGLMKMMLIGLGNASGAQMYHRACRDFPFSHVVRSASEVVRSCCPILCGMAIVENAYDRVARIEGVLPDEFLASEKGRITPTP